ncbi:MAG: bifunctional homocysteine S-methyltransferase/methylenetetrahydrofolate reductase [Myxococcales bacterium]|nr:bifunctional homocysteine S-methyltransferase/methylenetetrahydrofolate reductase [Myxococcales bacterium]MCB9531738.1 bifunctional homocysteine S-methyltransferase/methylenetetrahydrofolate reductase [Myxococcales bacterium]MCB9534095.1 bifunctional homocysteine S-methyltransferase/methylenetetrahydrofolate reductase [Myxococcales bacterium]
MSVHDFRERIARGPLVFDGAMGTELYRRGHFINKPFEGANLSDPGLVERIHAEYVGAGAEVIETNTFAANREKLRRVGLEADHDALNRAAVAIARRAAGDRAAVVGAIGPTGTKWGGLRADQREAYAAVFADQARVLIEAGVDAIALETFSHLAELEVALAAIRPLTSGVILALGAFTGNLATADGVTPGAFGRAALAAGADVIGANCAEGPMELYTIAEHLAPLRAPVAILPNAGYPKPVDGRMIYMATPEYFGVFARRFFKLGVAAVGGCCGTSPDHVRAMAGARRMMGGGAVKVELERQAPVTQENQPVPSLVPFEARTPLSEKIASSTGFVVSVEVNPPAGLDVTKAVEGAAMLKAAGVDVVNIADGPRATVRMSNWSLALKIREAVGMDAIVHVCMRDRNLLGLQSDILAFEALGLRNVVIITGDPPKMGDYPDATAVFDLDSIGAIRMVSNFNAGLNLAGRALGGQTSFVIACGAEPAALDYDRELRRLEQKVAAGAEFIMTQPVYDPDVLERFLRDIEGFRIPVLVGLMPLASSRNAEFLHNEVPGMQIPQRIRERMARFDKGAEARAEGVRVAQEMLQAVVGRVRGAYIMPPFGRYEAAIEVLEVVGYEIPEDYREGWRS